MLSAPAYLIDTLLLLTAAASMAAVGRAVQLRFLPDWHGPDLILARAIVALSTTMAWCYALGSVGAFSRWPLAIALTATGPAVHALIRPIGGRKAGARKYPAVAALWLLAGGIALLGIWLVHIRHAMRVGVTGTDPLWYHLPYALRFFQTGSLLDVNYAEPLFQTYFYPLSGSVFHALGMVFYERDFLSTWLNLGWLALAVVAGASIGHRKGVAATSALGVMTVFAADGVLRGSAGSAMVDVPATAFFLSACAILLRDPTGRPALLVAGLAAGLGLAFKLTVAIPLAVLTIGVFVLAEDGRRMRNVALWLASAATTSIFWFIRNFAETGNPLPWLDLPFLPSTGSSSEADSMKPISSYFTDPAVMLDQLPTAWTESLGPGAPITLSIAIAGSAAVVAFPPSRAWRVMALVALGAIAGYLFMPGTAAGPPDGPLRGLFLNTRFIAPGLSLALALAPINLRSAAPRWRNLSAAPMALLVILAASDSRWWRLVDPALPLLAAALIIGTAFAICANWARMPTGGKLATVLGITVLAVAGSKPIADHYAHGRDRSYSRSLAAQGAQRIGLVGEAGSMAQYLQSGDDLRNHVQYVGVLRPNGRFTPSGDCATLRDLINRGRYTYVIASPNRDIWRRMTVPNTEVSWIASDRNARFVKEIPGLARNRSSTGSLRPEPFRVYRIAGRLSPEECAGVRAQAGRDR